MAFHCCMRCWCAYMRQCFRKGWRWTNILAAFYTICIPKLLGSNRPGRNRVSGSYHYIEYETSVATTGWLFLFHCAKWILNFKHFRLLCHSNIPNVSSFPFLCRRLSEFEHRRKMFWRDLGGVLVFKVACIFDVVDRWQRCTWVKFFGG